MKFSSVIDTKHSNVGEFETNFAQIGYELIEIH